MKRCSICDSNSHGLSISNYDHPYSTRFVYTRDNPVDMICSYCAAEINSTNEEYDLNYSENLESGTDIDFIYEDIEDC